MNLTRIKKLIPRLSALLFLLAAILLLIYSAPVRKGVSAGLESCAAVLIPSLFPFMVLSGVLGESRAADSIQRILGPVVKRFFSPSRLYGMHGIHGVYRWISGRCKNDSVAPGAETD